jgi:hypothetical protein
MLFSVKFYTRKTKTIFFVSEDDGTMAAGDARKNIQSERVEKLELFPDIFPHNQLAAPKRDNLRTIQYVHRDIIISKKREKLVGADVKKTYPFHLFEHSEEIESGQLFQVFNGPHSTRQQSCKQFRIL